MPDINKLVQDPKFWEYGTETQKKILSKVDDRFGALSPKAQDIALSNMTSKSRFPAQPKEPSDVGRQVARTGGGIVGGLAASMGGPTSWWAVPAAVGFGASAAEGLYQVGEHIAGDPNAPQTSMQAIKQMGIAGGTEGAFELGGGLVARGAMKVLAPFAKKMLPEADPAIKLLKDKIKPQLLPSEATESRFLDVLENVTEGSILGGGKMKQFKLLREDVLEDISDDFIQQFGKKLSPDEMGEALVSAIEHKQTVHRKVSNSLYNTVSSLSEGVMVPTTSLKKFSKPLAEVAGELEGIASQNAGDDIISAVTELPDNISFDAAKELRTRLMSKIDEFNVTNKKAPAIGKAKKLIGLIDNEIENALPPEALGAWRMANDFYKNWQGRYNNIFIRRLLKHADETGQGPQLIGKTIVKPNAVENIKRIKSALSPKEFETVQSFAVQDLYSKSLNAETRMLDGKKLISNLFYKPTGMGKNVLSEIFSPAQLDSLNTFGKTLEMAQRRQSEGLGRMWIQLAQGTAVATVIGSGVAMDIDSEFITGGASIILFGPAILGRMMTKPLVVKYLTRGLQLPARSPEVVGIMARLLGAAKRIKQGTEGE